LGKSAGAWSRARCAITGRKPRRSPAHARRPADKGLRLEEIIVACIPNGLLQERYNPSARSDNFWRAGRNAPSRGEEFRVRVNLKALARVDAWRVTRWRVR